MAKTNSISRSAQLAIVIGLLVFDLSSAAAQWIPLGLDSVDIRMSSVAASDSELFIGASKAWYDNDGNAVPPGDGYGVFRSVDNGYSWQPSITGIEHRSILSMLVHEPSVLAGTDSGIFTSSDRGRTWRLFAFPDRRIQKMTHAGTVLFVRQFDASAVFRSWDNGVHWDTIGDYSEVIDFAGNDSVLVDGGVGGVYLARGTERMKKVDGLPHEETAALAITGQTIYASQRAIAGLDSLYISRDNGRTWKALLGGIRATSLEIIDSHVCFVSSVGYAGMFDLDGQNLRTFEQFGGLKNHALRLSGNKSALILETDDNKFTPVLRPKYVSIDLGKTWTRTCESITGILEVHEIGSKIFVCTASHGLYISDTGNIRWIHVTGIPDTKINTIMHEGQMIFLGTQSSGVVRSTDGGESWLTSNSGLGSRSISSLARWKGTLICATLTGTGAGNVFQSVDNGEHWTILADVPASFCLHVAGETLLCGTLHGIRSSDDNFKTRGINVPVTGFAQSGSVIYATFATDDGWPEEGIYQSTDAGGSWTLMKHEQSMANTPAAQGPIVLYGTVLSGEVHLWDGSAWQDLSDPLDQQVYALDIGKSNLYVGNRRAVYRRPLASLLTNTSNVSIQPLPQTPSASGLVAQDGTVLLDIAAYRTILLHDILGKQLSLQDRLIDNGSTLRLDLHGLPKGIYLLTIDGRNVRITNN